MIKAKCLPSFSFRKESVKTTDRDTRGRPDWKKKKCERKFAIPGGDCRPMCGALPRLDGNGRSAELDGEFSNELWHLNTVWLPFPSPLPCCIYVLKISHGPGLQLSFQC